MKNPLVTHEIVVERLKTCAACPELKKGLVHTCKACGCMIRAKVILAASDCPKGNWKR